MKNNILIYGVTGYTGKLIISEAREKGLTPVIAGRNEEKVKNLATESGLNYLVFDLSDTEVIVGYIKDFSVVLHCAGPFRNTAKPMVEACIRSGVHYLDITGEIAIMDWIKLQDERARQIGIMLMCGVGFDLVPTDCLAMKLKNKLPDATHLEIAFYMKDSGISHGTMSTMVGNLGEKSFSRIDSVLVQEPLGKNGKEFQFGSENKFCISIPWGDLFSAFYSTGIPNISTYIASNKWLHYVLKFHIILNPVLKNSLTRKFLNWYVDKFVTGPSAEKNLKGKSFVTGIAFNSQKRLEIQIVTAESYRLTALSSLHIAQLCASGNYKIGFQTPATCYGENLIFDIDGSKVISEKMTAAE